jgi:hypothetical protein
MVVSLVSEFNYVKTDFKKKNYVKTETTAYQEPACVGQCSYQQLLRASGTTHAHGPNLIIK